MEENLRYHPAVYVTSINKQCSGQNYVFYSKSQNTPNAFWLRFFVVFFHLHNVAAFLFKSNSASCYTFFS